jgi:signal transduction histidine kinase
VRDGRERWLAISGVDFGEGAVYALQDVTDEHALEKTRSDFVATASHELRTPLAAVYGAVRTLRREDVELSEEHRAAFLDMIESESLRLSKIVGQILLAGQLDADAVELSISECDPLEIAADVIESASVHLPDGILLGLSAEGARSIDCDEAKLKQVLVNLVDNATKYSPDGSQVTIRLDQNGAALIESPTGGWASRRRQDRIFEVLPARPAAAKGLAARSGPLSPRARRAHGRS